MFSFKQVKIDFNKLIFYSFAMNNPIFELFSNNSTFVKKFAHLIPYY